MSSENRENFTIEYQAGKAAFERGQYRQAVQHLESAIALESPSSQLGGEVQMWLVTAYEAVGLQNDAIALCKQLTRHTDPETRKQAKRVLYIMEAPALSKRPEWLTKIPDLTALPEGNEKYRATSPTGSAKRRPAPPKEPEPVDLSKVNTKDNRFIWVALVLAGLTLGGLIWWNF